MNNIPREIEPYRAQLFALCRDQRYHAMRETWCNRIGQVLTWLILLGTSSAFVAVIDDASRGGLALKVSLLLATAAALFNMVVDPRSRALRHQELVAAYTQLEERVRPADPDDADLLLETHQQRKRIEQADGDPYVIVHLLAHNREAISRGLTDHVVKIPAWRRLVGWVVKFRGYQAKPCDQSQQEASPPAAAASAA
jgi:hypothetical protein